MKYAKAQGQGEYLCKILHVTELLVHTCTHSSSFHPNYTTHQTNKKNITIILYTIGSKVNSDFPALKYVFWSGALGTKLYMWQKPNTVHHLDNNISTLKHDDGRIMLSCPWPLGSYFE